MSFRNFLFVFASVLMVSCGKIEEPEILVDNNSKLNLVQNDIPADAKFAETITFTSNKAWAISISAETKASDDISWVKVSPDHGDAGTYTLNISLDENNNPSPRSVIISIVSGDTSQDISITQNGARISIFNVWKITGMDSETGATGSYEAFEKSTADGFDVAEMLLGKDESGKWVSITTRNYAIVSGDIYGGIMKYQQINALGRDRGMTYTFAINGNDMTLVTAGNDGSWSNTLYLTRVIEPFEYLR